MLDKKFQILINTIKKNNYTFVTFDKKHKNKKLFYLRFDVDISPNSALAIGNLLYKKKIKANFFFQINAETYNCFSKDIIDIIKVLKVKNHCVGLHLDRGLTDANQVKETINWFSKNITKIDNVVSFHRPLKTVLEKKFKGVVSTYEKNFFSHDNYLSDSRNQRDFLPKLYLKMKSNEKKIQLLLHPVWWNKIQNEKTMYDEIIKRRTSELNDYLYLNFKKVFKKFVTRNKKRAI